MAEAEEGETFPRLHICDAFDALQWWPQATDAFIVPSDCTALEALRQCVFELPEGSCLGCRGRDREGSFNGFTEWDYGFMVKRASRLFFMYESGDMESFNMYGVDLLDLVNIAARPVATSPMSALAQPSNNVVLISHGWSMEDGPNYPLVRTLETVAQRAGWRTVVPDFRATYEFGTARGRSERVRTIYEELLCLEPRPDRVALVGHSQGGAASAHACKDRVVEAMNIKGLLMVGSENPMSMDGMGWIPAVPLKQMVHAVGDKIISLSDIKRCAIAWDAQLYELESNVEAGAMDCWGDDVNHDFLAKDLIQSVTQIFREFLEICESN